jgi:Flp pilus assembly protein TadB
MSGWRPPSSAVPGPQLRVSDAERAQVADALSKHFADGRLDQAELDERVQRAMAAKTRADLAGLFDDLPPLEPAAPGLEVGRRRRPTVAFVVVAALVFVAAFWAAAWSWHVPWLVVGIVLFLVWRRSRRGWHRHRLWGWHQHGPVPAASYPGRRGGWWR